MKKEEKATNVAKEEKKEQKTINGFRSRFTVSNSKMKEVLGLAFDNSVIVSYKSVVPENKRSAVKVSGDCESVSKFLDAVFALQQEINDSVLFLNSVKVTGIYIEEMPNIPFVELSNS